MVENKAEKPDFSGFESYATSFGLEPQEVWKKLLRLSPDHPEGQRITDAIHAIANLGLADMNGSHAANYLISILDSLPDPIPTEAEFLALQMNAQLRERAQLDEERIQEMLGSALVRQFILDAKGGKIKRQPHTVFSEYKAPLGYDDWERYRQIQMAMHIMNMAMPHDELWDKIQSGRFDKYL